MKIAGAFDPKDSDSVWDGLSLNTERVSRENDQSPNSEDYDRTIGEIIAIENALVDHESRLGDNTGGTASAVSGVSVTSDVGAAVRQTTIAVTAVAMTTTDDATHGAFCSAELFDLPEGNILILGGVASLALTAGAGGLADTAAIVGGIGTSAAAQSGSDGALAAAEANIIPSTALTLAGGVKAATKLVSTGQLNADGTASAKKVYMNFQCPTAGSSATDTLTVTGTVTLNWIKLGDA